MKIVNYKINHIDYHSKWDQFIRKHPHGVIYQTPFMFKIFSETKDYEPIALLALDNNNNVCGVVVAVIQYFMSGILRKFSSRSVIWGGPLAKEDDPDIISSLLNAYEMHTRNSALFTEIRNQFNINEQRDTFLKSGYSFEDHLNILINLKKSEDALWKEVHSKRRNEIRRATKEGAVFQESSDLVALNSGYNILKEVYSRANIPIPDFSLFESALSHSTEETGLKIFNAISDGEIIGTMFTLIYKSTIIDWQAGAKKSHYNKYPNDLIPWEVFKWGREKGYEVFDFGGAGDPSIPYGVREYKKKFGGDMINLGRFIKIHKPFSMKISNLGLNIVRSFKFFNHN